MEVWLVTSTDLEGHVTSTVFAREAKQQAVDYACMMDAQGWDSHVMLEMVLTTVPVTVRHEMASQQVQRSCSKFDQLADRLSQ